MMAEALRELKGIESLDTLIDQATNPNSVGDNNAIAESFADQVNREFDGPQRGIKLITQKLQLHQESVSLQALNVLECCVKNCGKKFHQELGKYRFLNELIKLLSPKYDGDITSQPVKDRIVELFYSWHIGLPKEGKISEAYKMLKQQGIIKRDPQDPVNPEGFYPPKPRNTVFEDEEKSKLLANLLKSTNPEDLQAANRLIKTMVKQEEERLDKVSRRIQELETVSNNVKLLCEMLSLYNPTISDSDKEIMKDLYESCLNMRPQLFRLANATADEKDDSISSVQPPDTLLDIGFDPAAPPAVPTTSEPSSLLDEQFKLLGLDVPATTTSATQPQIQTNSQAAPHFPSFHQPGIQTQPSQPWPGGGMVSQRMQFGQQPMQQPFVMNQPGAAPFNRMQTSPMFATANSSATVLRLPPKQEPENKSKTRNDPFDFDIFNTYKKESSSNSGDIDSLLTINGNITEDKQDNKPNSNVEIGTNLLTDTSTTAVDSLLDLTDTLPPPPTNSLPSKPTTAENESTKESSGDGYTVPLDCIQPSDQPPVNVYDKSGIKTILNIVKGKINGSKKSGKQRAKLSRSFETECCTILKAIIKMDTRESASPNVTVTVLSTISTNPTPVKEFSIQAAVPKAMRLKLQAPSGSELPAYNPLFPPSAITQIMLIANPKKEKIIIRFQVSYTSGSSKISETVDLNDFPVT